MREEQEKSISKQIYEYFLNTLNDRHYFRKPDNEFSYLYVENGKLIVCGGIIKKHSIDITLGKDRLLLVIAYYRVFV